MISRDGMRRPLAITTVAGLVLPQPQSLSAVGAGSDSGSASVSGTVSLRSGSAMAISGLSGSLGHQSAGNGSTDTGGGANFTAADLTGADLSHANLAGAKLTAANLTQVFYDKNTTWPQGFIPPPSRAAP
jgi:hypothetical protein